MFNKSYLIICSPVYVFALDHDHLRSLLRHLHGLLLLVIGHHLLWLVPNLPQIVMEFLAIEVSLEIMINFHHDSLHVLGRQCHLISHVSIPVMEVHGELIEVEGSRAIEIIEIKCSVNVVSDCIFLVSPVVHFILDNILNFI